MNLFPKIKPLCDSCLYTVQKWNPVVFLCSPLCPCSPLPFLSHFACLSSEGLKRRGSTENLSSASEQRKEMQLQLQRCQNCISLFTHWQKIQQLHQVKPRNMISMDPDDNSFYMLLHQRRNHPVCENNGAGKWDNCSLLSVFYGQCSGNGFIPQFYIQTGSDISLFYLVYKWMVLEMYSHSW